MEGIGRWSLEKVKHVFGSLLKVGIAGECGKGDFFREKINLEDIAFGHGVGEVTFPTPVVFERRTDIPTNLSVCAVWRARVGGSMGNYFGAGRGKWSSIEVEVAEEGGMGR